LGVAYDLSSTTSVMEHAMSLTKIERQAAQRRTTDIINLIAGIDAAVDASATGIRAGLTVDQAALFKELVALRLRLADG
jgi:hypothetical protein